MVADLCPSICCTTFTFAPDAIASDAAVWRKRVWMQALEAQRRGRLGQDRALEPPAPAARRPSPR